MTTFSIADELNRLEPMPTEFPEREAAPSQLALWSSATQMIAKLGKQQMRANQNAEALAQSLGKLTSELESARELADDLRRERDRLRRAAWDTRLEILEIVDRLDDLMAISRQRSDHAWSDRVAKLTAGTLATLSAVGVTEVATLTFDERFHEAIGAAEAGGAAYEISEVNRRGFIFDTVVLRKAQVIVNR
jgi:molecular chaperone GrpE (heat shock protein)